MKLRCVNDTPRNCALNIALDEVFFTKEPFENILRFYRWTEKAYTIGYFQKLKIRGLEDWMLGNDVTAEQRNGERQKIVRRLTGGLAVLHDKDLSYSLIVSDDIWKYIYDQEKTYKVIHDNIKKSLVKIGKIAKRFLTDGSIEGLTDGNDEKKEKQNFSCIKTLYKDDLIFDGRKIVGSCQRRRGRKILVEGSIHLALSDEQINIFTEDFFKNISRELQCDIIKNSLTKEEIFAGEKLCNEKYNNEKWNKLF